jgi:hypothetical protein
MAFNILRKIAMSTKKYQNALHVPTYGAATSTSIK